MNLAKLNPWNWFKHKDGATQAKYTIQVKNHEHKSTQPAVNYGVNSLLRLHREMDQLFDEVFNIFGMPNTHLLPSLLADRGSLLNDNFKPLIDVSGGEKYYKIDLDVPGIQESDLSIEVKGDTLLIKGKKEESSETKDKHYYCLERSVGSFERTLSLPDDADIGNVSATLKDGVLMLDIPRAELKIAETKKISIK